VSGDVVGIPNHGLLSVGDSLTEGEKLRFTGIPSFAPEILRRVRLEEAIKAKQLGKALNDLAEEGVAQVFRPMIGADWIVGVVGPLQLDVLATRIAAEYGIAMSFETAGCETARWLVSDDNARLEAFLSTNRASAATDRDGAPVFLARNAWALGRAIEDWPEIAFLATRERG
jgi:peptide chain release factor 3